MARMIRSDAVGPHRIDPQDTPVFVCMCGLTQNRPFCDGSHKSCKSEQPGELYVYNRDRNEVVRVEDDPDD